MARTRKEKNLAIVLKLCKEQQEQVGRVLDEPGLIDMLTEAREQRIDVRLVVKDGIRAQKAGKDPIEYIKKRGYQHYKLKS